MHILTISVFSTLYIPNAPVQRNATLLCIARIYKKKITNLDQKPPFQCMLLKPKFSFVKLNVNYNNISLTHIFCDLINDKWESIKNAFVCDIQKCTFSPCIESKRERVRERVENATNKLIWVLFSE